MTSEAILQQTVFKMVTSLYPDLVFALSLNGIDLSGLSTIQRAKLIADLRKQGLIRGISDFALSIPEGKTLHIELKKPGRTNGQSDDQVIIQNKLEKLGHTYYLCNSVDCVFDAIKQHTTQEFRDSQKLIATDIGMDTSEYY